jgi:putative FmdB family regulatory protein
MPIYEFYCADCHTIFKFLSKIVNTTKRPICPRCQKVQLERRMSVFSFSRGKQEAEEPDMPHLDEDKLERSMQALAREAEGIKEEDPRQAARLMRKVYDATGLKLGPGMQEAIRRMEAGEDPEEIEAELGDLMETEGPFAEPSTKIQPKKSRPPAKDDHLYEL